MTGPLPILGEGPVLIRVRPGFLFVLFFRQGWWLGPSIVAFVVHAALRGIWQPDPAPWLVTAAIAWLLIGLLIRIVAWQSRTYTVTAQTLSVRAGLLSRVAADLPLNRIQHTTITRSVFERMFNLGTVGVATAGADGAVVNLLMIPKPEEFVATLRDAVRRPAPPQSMTTIPVIGLAGGVGAGKSEVARVMADLGCFVIDSDKEAKEVLDRPAVRDQLVKWWGAGVLGADGGVNRKAIADIVFKNDKDRAALEALIHPMVKSRRGDLRRAAAERHARAVVIDAPLLFEAGVDAECDWVIFVDAPRADRLARVASSRGWSESEMDRREAAQFPIEEKRRRSTHVLSNAGSPSDLRSQAASLLNMLAPG